MPTHRLYYLAFEIMRNGRLQQKAWRVTRTTNDLATSDGVQQMIRDLEREVDGEIWLVFWRELDA